MMQKESKKENNQWEETNVFSMDYLAWPTELIGDTKLKQFVIKSHYNVSQHSKWKPCDSWLNQKEGSWKAASFAHLCSLPKRFLPGAVPGLPSSPQILHTAFGLWAGSGWGLLLSCQGRWTGEVSVGWLLGSQLSRLSTLNTGIHPVGWLSGHLVGV